MNRTGPDGAPMTCHKCKSVYNFISQCDSKDETLLQVGIIHEEEKERKANEGSEWCGYLAILDSGCDTSIAGVKWIEDYTRGQKGKRKQEIEDMQESRNAFVFGDGTQVKFKGITVILILTHKGEATIRVDVVENDIPMIISQTEMRSLEIVLDLVKEKLEVKGETRELLFTRDGLPAIRVY